MSAGAVLQHVYREDRARMLAALIRVLGEQAVVARVCACSRFTLSAHVEFILQIGAHRFQKPESFP